MGIKKLLAVGGIAGVVLLAGTCRLVDQEEPTDDTTVVTDTLKESFGAVTITLDDVTSLSSLLGRINDGPTPSNLVWEEADAVGGCKLYKRRIPVCMDGCGSTSACVEDDSCQPYPKGINVGTMTVTGLKTVDGATSFTVDPLSNNYQLIGITLQYPPADEGDLITISAAGSGTVPPFSMSARGIKPLKLLNESIPCGDGQDINLKWEPPADPSQSVIHYFVDLSHHGGIKGKIEGTCPDNGSFTIPATLLDRLKSYGVFGYPKIEVTRMATGINATVKVKLIIESKVTMLLDIPGIYSCMEASECPDGLTCGEGFLCR
ncbi:MAG: hypothetical protein JW863_16755 [Chitinispirillaceae bacterium]|nr:hypothetical protein [Chitinispirillaceae bacterium]